MRRRSTAVTAALPALQRRANRARVCWRGTDPAEGRNDETEENRMTTTAERLPCKRDSVARLVVACTGVLVLFALVAAAAAARPVPQTVVGDPLDPRTYAPDSRLFLVVSAGGVQKYACQPNGTWLFTDPEATLYSSTGKPIGSHFLNFATGRPHRDGVRRDREHRLAAPARGRDDDRRRR